MSGDEEHTGSVNHDGTRPPARNGPGAGRLPPPAFPPGARRRQAHWRTRELPDELGEGFISPDDPIPQRSKVPDEAFISPDEPIPARSSVPDSAFISPDEPIVRTHTAIVEDEEEEGEGIVTGMGDDAHMSPDELAAAGDPHVMDVVDKVGKLAEALRRKGEAGLRTTPEMTRFESTLRAYCVGYLAGRRTEDEEF